MRLSIFPEMLTPWTLPLMIACTGDDSSQVDWVVDTVELGEPVASGTGYVFDSPQAAWLAAEHVVPGLTWTWPASNVPLFLWNDVLLGENVSDEGTCPYVTATGGAETWKTDCRSQDGYDWDGYYTVDESEEDLWTRFAYDLDLEVSSDVEGRAFDRVLLRGPMVYVDGDDDPMVRSSQSNLVIEATGYWSRGFEDELEAAWSHLAVSGRWEGSKGEGGESVTLEAALDLGSWEGFTASGVVMVDTCLLEPKGEVTLVGAQTATLTFQGEGACDGCAELTIDGERQANACRGF